MKILFVILFSALSVLGQTNTYNSINYKIKPIPTNDRTNLEISVNFKAENNKPLVVKLPTDYYGTPTIHKYVTSFEGKNGTMVKNTEVEIERLIEPNSKGEVSLEYVISYDPKILEDYAFAPKVNANYFHIAGCQWLLHIGDNEKKQRFIVKVVDSPKDWHLYSSIDKTPQKFETVATYFDLVPTAIGGGKEMKTFRIREQPVSIFVQGNFDIPKAEIYDSVEKIVRLQRDWFADFEQPFYHVTINERDGIIAGTAIENLFVCFIKPKVKPDELNIAIAHEMFHNWLPTKMRIKLAKGDKQVRHEWFFEGFTEYFAKKILVDAGLLSREKFAESINKDIYNLTDNPNKSVTYADLLAKINAKEFTSEHKKLSYYRGVLIALKWENVLRNSKHEKSLSDFIRRLYKFVSERKREITEAEFFKLASDYGIDARGDFNEYILQGKLIKVASNALGGDFTLTEKETPSFEPGFSLKETYKTQKISGVIKNGVAYRAGLRNGMDFVRATNASRYSNAWTAEKPLTVIVKINGKEKKFEYFPHGEMLSLPQFKLKEN